METSVENTNRLSVAEPEHDSEKPVASITLEELIMKAMRWNHEPPKPAKKARSKAKRKRD